MKKKNSTIDINKQPLVINITIKLLSKNLVLQLTHANETIFISDQSPQIAWIR